MKYIWENVQIHTTRLVDGLNDLKYSDLPTLVHRRAHGDIEMYKQFHVDDKDTITSFQPRNLEQSAEICRRRQWYKYKARRTSTAKTQGWNLATDHRACESVCFIFINYYYIKCHFFAVCYYQLLLFILLLPGEFSFSLLSAFFLPKLSFCPLWAQFGDGPI